ncbi:hypothetical protein BASA81_006391 [Batrachochytrium salamandrivorans]|nr:hypothetical protein BASA81_006391 [Batrachochytrium salamandrivorans]
MFPEGFLGKLAAGLEPEVRVLALSVAKLFVSQKREWKDVGIYGCLLYGANLTTRTQYLRIYDLASVKLRFQCELSFEPMFNMETEHFHTLELDKVHIGLLHAHASACGSWRSEPRKFAMAIAHYRLTGNDLKLARKRTATTTQGWFPTSIPQSVFPCGNVGKYGMDFCPDAWKSLFKPAAVVVASPACEAVVKYDFMATAKSQQSVWKGQRVVVLHVFPDGWTRLQASGGNGGLVPTAYLEMTKPEMAKPTMPIAGRRPAPAPPAVTPRPAPPSPSVAVTPRPAPAPPVASRPAPARPTPIVAVVAPRPAPAPPLVSAPRPAPSVTPPSSQPKQTPIVASRRFVRGTDPAGTAVPPPSSRPSLLLAAIVQQQPVLKPPSNLPPPPVASKPSLLDAIASRPKLRSAAKRVVSTRTAVAQEDPTSLANVFSKAMDNIRGAMHGDDDEDSDEEEENNWD